MFFGKFAKRVGNNSIFLVCFLTYIFFNYRQSPCKSIVLDDSAKSASIDVSQPHHAKTTDHAKPTDRLANDEVVMIIRSTYKKHGMYMRDRIIPSSRTWMRGLINVFVVLEDTFEVRSYLRHCTEIESTDTSSFSCPNDEPIYVLTRNCTEGYYGGDALCCKFDAAINFIASAGNADIYRKMKFLIETDDDTFWRVDQLLRWLYVIDNSGYNHLPVVGNPDQTLNTSFLSETRRKNAVKDREKGQWQRVFGVKNSDHCKAIEINGWYHPVLLNKAAVDLVKEGTSQYSTRSLCKSFRVSQDIGIGILFWMYRMYHIQIPGFEGTSTLAAEVERKSGINRLHPLILGIHSIKHLFSEDCEGWSNSFPPSMRYHQGMAVGCGMPGTPVPRHNTSVMVDMYDLWQWFRDHGEDLTFSMAGLNGFIRATDVTATATADNDVTMTATAAAAAALTASDNTAAVTAATYTDQDSPNRRKNPATTSVGVPPIRRRQDSHPSQIASVGGSDNGVVVVPSLRQLSGYDTTMHSKKNDVRSQWVDFTPQDC